MSKEKVTNLKEGKVMQKKEQTPLKIILVILVIAIFLEKVVTFKEPMEPIASHLIEVGVAIYVSYLILKVLEEQRRIKLQLSELKHLLKTEESKPKEKDKPE